MIRSKSTIFFLFLVFFLSGAQNSFSKNLNNRIPPRYIVERTLGSLKIKLSDNFSIGTWGALYFGEQKYPVPDRLDPFRYQGYDIVPGFDCGLGTIFTKIKVNAGGDFYCQVRQRHNALGETYQYIYEIRPRANVGFSVPFAGTSMLQYIQRIERQIQNTFDFGKHSSTIITYFRYRSVVKLAGPKFTALKISPFASYESFNGTGNYFYEADFGMSFSPVKDLGISLSYMIFNMPEDINNETHQICLNLSYTINAANGFSNFIRSIKSPE